MGRFQSRDTGDDMARTVGLGNDTLFHVGISWDFIDRRGETRGVGFIRLCPEAQPFTKLELALGSWPTCIFCLTWHAGLV